MSELAPNNSSLQAAAPTSNRGPILVIEDNPAIADMICLALELAGYQAMACAGRDAALTWINRALEGGHLPALILLDVDNLPKNGADFLSHLRRQLGEAHCSLPAIILLTTSRAIHDELAAVERVILKPFHVFDLMAEVQKVLPPKIDQTPNL
jgi:DNA-binding response OmpR family regulator